MMTKRKLTDFSLAKEKYGSPVIFRELAFIQSHFTNVMNKKTTDYNSIRLLLNDWDRINKTYDVWSDENEEIRKLMRIDGHLLSKRLKSMGRYVTADKDIYTNLIMLARVANPPNINPKEISIDGCF